MKTLDRLRQMIPHYVVRNVITGKFGVIFHGQLCAGGAWVKHAENPTEVFVEEEELNRYWTVEELQ